MADGLKNVLFGNRHNLAELKDTAEILIYGRLMSGLTQALSHSMTLAVVKNMSTGWNRKFIDFALFFAQGTKQRLGHLQ